MTIRLAILAAFVLSLLILMPDSGIAHAATTNNCFYAINESNGSYALVPGACSSYNISIPYGVSNSSVICSGGSQLMDINISSKSRSDAFYNCSFSGNSRMSVQNNSSAYIIGSTDKPSHITLDGSNSSVTIGYFLRVNVFEPYGYNSTSTFLNRVAAFGYLYPTLNNTSKLYQTELTLNASYLPPAISFLNNLSKSVPFGVYDQSQTEIYENQTNTSYGKIVSNKVFKVAAYTLYNNRTVNYNPYSMIYSFFAFDQLIYFSLNITGNMNLTPLYVQPLYPKFNYYILPNNGKHNITIEWLVAVPPQDYNWNFTTLLYRYNADLSFTVNPVNATSGLYSTIVKTLESSINPPANSTLGQDASVVKMLQAPNSTYNYTLRNGTRFYLLKYNTNMPVSKNSSITMSIGNGGSNIHYVQDSTTPTFGFGLAFCATQANSTSINSMLEYTGYYSSVPVVYPVSQRGPLLVDAPCNVTTYITGKNIFLNCNGAVFNDQLYGIGFIGAKNVTVNGCRIYGNGLYLNNSSDIRITNTTLAPSSYNDSFGIKAVDSDNISLYNVSIAAGYVTQIMKYNSTLYMQDVNYNATSPPTTTILSSTTTTIPGNQNNSESRNDLILYASTAILIIVYLAVFLAQRIKPKRSMAAHKRQRQ